MNLHKRFMVQFFIQLFLLSLVFLLLMITVWAIIGFTVTEDEIQRDLSDADASYFIDKIVFADEGASIKEEVRKLAESQDGWLILLNWEGVVVDSVNEPEKLPPQFTVDIFTERLWDSIENSRQYSYWKLEDMDGDPLFLLYGKENAAANLLASAEAAIDWQEGSLNLSPQVKEQLKEEGAWIQLVGPEGKVMDSYGQAEENGKYTIEKLGELNETNRSTAAVRDPETGQTVIAGIEAAPSKALKTILKTRNFYAVLLFLLVPLIGGTFWYARKFGLPLLVLMQWIQNLGDGRYEQPANQKNRPLVTNEKGKVKKKYRLYKDLVATLEQLTATLKLHKHQQEKLERTREDWISGLSHDLKTPLSSISGYAQMLESPDYQWSERETREFAAIMNEKSSYMMELLEELTLTFRLKNQALPLVKEQVDINEFIRRIVIQFINNPANSKLEFTFNPSIEKIKACVDLKWFQRIIDNLIVNAMKYNPPGTEIKVSVSSIEQHLFVVVIEDNGIGMETEILDKLFDRYYRGTNTHDSSTGTGLGLAITKQLIQLHGGSIQVTSTLEKGTAVRMIIPV